MKIDVKSYTVEFINLKPGQTFRLGDKYYIAISTITKGEVTYNAVRLRTGMLLAIKSYEHVEQINLVAIEDCEDR